ncbi:MAG: translocation/assembly module TamB domain-containing protein [Rhodocyclaceae bacterium]|nr:translocation/assembly module TamB domain-containing protein [Rhodocyclaceae bacterium]MDZ4215402.1 translocation/assembly module TamB domain-containing protein [Rhodocyclaceae bacterium]
MKPETIRHLLRRAVLLIPTLIALLFFAASGWLLLTQSGLERAVTFVGWASEDAVRIAGARGHLIGPLTFEQVEIAADAGRYTLYDIALDWDFFELLQRQIDIQRLRIERLEFTRAENETNAPPADLRLPLAVRVAALEIGRLAVHGASAPLAEDIAATFASDGETHRLESLTLKSAAGPLTAQGTLAGAAPFALTGEGTLATTTEPALAVAARADGTLTDIAVAFDGRGADFSLDGQARLAPFAAQPLAALRLTARGLDPRAFVPSAPRARLALDADLASAADGALAGRLRVDNAAAAPLDRDGLPLTHLAADLRLDWNNEPRRVQFSDLSLKVGARGTATGSVDLVWPAGEALPHGNAALAVRGLDPAELHGALFPARLNGRIVFAGDGATQRATLALADGARRIEATVDRRGKQLNFSRLLIAQGKAEISGSGAFALTAPHTWRMEGALRHVDPAAFVTRLPRGDLNAGFTAEGKFRPQLAGTLRFRFDPSRLDSQQLRGVGDLSFSAIDRIDDLIAANGRAWLRGTLDLALGDSKLALRGGWGEPQERLSLTLVAVDLPAGVDLPRLELSFDGTRGQHQLAATIDLPEKRRLALTATGTLVDARDWRDTGWRGRIETLRLDSELPAVLTASGELSVSRAALSGRLTGGVPDLAGLGPLAGNLVSAGALEFDATLAGSPSAPRLAGQVRGSGLALSLLEHNVHLRDGVLALRFEDERAVLERLDFVAPQAPPPGALRNVGLTALAPGRVSVSGEFDIQRRQARFDATLTRLPLSQRPERWLVASGTARLAHAAGRLQLGAQLEADAGFIAEAAASRPKLAEDIVVRGRESKAARPLRVDTDIALDLGPRFHLRAAGLTARLAGKVRLRGDGESPLAASGSIATQEASFEAYGQRLAVERGIVNFQGPLDDPGLNVLALRKGLAVEAGVAVTGTAQRPLVRLVSTPPVPDAEKLSWIVLGRAPDAGGADTSLLIAAAGAMLGGQSGSITGQIAQALGVDEFSLRQAADGDTLAHQILTVGKRLSDRAWLGYEQGLTAATGALKFTYALTPRISIVSRTGGDNAVDVFYNFHFD